MKHYSRVESSWKEICVNYLCQLKISSSPIYLFFFPCRIWPKTVTPILNFPFGSALGAKNQRVQVWFHCAVRRPQEKKKLWIFFNKMPPFPSYPMLFSKIAAGWASSCVTGSSCCQPGALGGLDGERVLPFPALLGGRFNFGHLAAVS